MLSFLLFLGLFLLFLDLLLLFLGFFLLFLDLFLLFFLLCYLICLAPDVSVPALVITATLIVASSCSSLSCSSFSFVFLVLFLFRLLLLFCLDLRCWCCLSSSVTLDLQRVSACSFSSFRMYLISTTVLLTSYIQLLTFWGVFVWVPVLDNHVVGLDYPLEKSNLENTVLSHTYPRRSTILGIRYFSFMMTSCSLRLKETVTVSVFSLKEQMRKR